MVADHHQVRRRTLLGHGPPINRRRVFADHQLGYGLVGRRAFQPGDGRRGEKLLVGLDLLGDRRRP